MGNYPLAVPRETKQIIQDLDYVPEAFSANEIVPGHGKLIFQRGDSKFYEVRRREKKSRIDRWEDGGGSGGGNGTLER